MFVRNGSVVTACAFGVVLVIITIYVGHVRDAQDIQCKLKTKKTKPTVRLNVLMLFLFFFKFCCEIGDAFLISYIIFLSKIMSVFHLKLCTEQAPLYITLIGEC